MIEYIIKIGKAIVWASAILLFVWIIDRNVVPGGILTVVCTADECSRLVTKFGSDNADRVIGESATKERYRLMSKEIFRVNVNPPKRFSKATVEVEYADPQGQPLMQIGLAGQRKGVASRNAVVEQLKAQWDMIKEGDLLLLTRPKKVQNKKETAVKHFSSIQDFLDHLPPIGSIRTFQYDFESLVRIPNYTAPSAPRVVTKSFRGAHEMLLYTAGEPIDVRLTLQDINRHAGKDDVKLVLTYGGKTVAEQALADDGVTKATGAVSSQRDLNITVPKPQRGVYHLSLQTNDDVFVRRLSYSTNAFMFRDHIYLTDNAEYKMLDGIGTGPTSLSATGTSFSAYTSHVQSLQTIRIGNKDLSLKTVNQTYKTILPLSGKLLVVSVPKNDVYLSGNGYFAFSESELFASSLVAPATLGANIPAVADYVLARYPQPQTLGNGWFLAKAQFSVDEMIQKDGGYPFTISFPGLESSRGTVKLRSVRISFERDPITLAKVVQKIRDFIPGL